MINYDKIEEQLMEYFGEVDFSNKDRIESSVKQILESNRTHLLSLSIEQDSPKLFYVQVVASDKPKDSPGVIRVELFEFDVEED